MKDPPWSQHPPSRPSESPRMRRGVLGPRGAGGEARGSLKNTPVRTCTSPLGGERPAHLAPVGSRRKSAAAVPPIYCEEPADRARGEGRRERALCRRRYASCRNTFRPARTGTGRGAPDSLHRILVLLLVDRTARGDPENRNRRALECANRPDLGAG